MRGPVALSFDSGGNFRTTKGTQLSSVGRVVGRVFSALVALPRAGSRLIVTALLAARGEEGVVTLIEPGLPPHAVNSAAIAAAFIVKASP